MRIARKMEMAHTNFTEVTRMVFIKVGSEHAKKLVSVPYGVETDETYRWWC